MDQQPKPTYVMDWTALLAYLAIGVAVIMALSFGIDLLANRFGFSELVEIGRRRNFGFIVALILGLPITRCIAKALNLTPKRVDSD